jgi:hypothetical protein
METQEDEISLVDIAKIPSQVHTKVVPSHMLDTANAPFVGRDGKYYLGNAITKAIIDDDFEAFVQLLDLYQGLPQKANSQNILNSLITTDRPAMLDEYIRRTGEGIVLKKPEDKPDATTTDQDENLDEDGPRVYLGLNVHGKKRKDLAAEANNQNHRDYYPSDDIPMLWHAARSGSIAILRYLASEQPLAAYKFYASSHGDSKAKMLRRIPDLTTVLPEKLGWTPSALNETVVTAAIAGGKLDILEALTVVHPKELDTGLHLKYVRHCFCFDISMLNEVFADTVPWTSTTSCSLLSLGASQRC